MTASPATPNPAEELAREWQIKAAADKLPHRDYCGGYPCMCAEVRIGTVELVLKALAETGLVLKGGAISAAGWKSPGEVETLIPAAEQCGREDNAEHGQCYVFGSEALRAKLVKVWDAGYQVGEPYGFALAKGTVLMQPDPRNPYERTDR